MQKLRDNKEIEIYCPSCAPLRKLIVKTNRHTDSQFLGCPNWPECNYTRPIPESIRMEQAGQPKLF